MSVSVRPAWVVAVIEVRSLDLRRWLLIAERAALLRVRVSAPI